MSQYIDPESLAAIPLFQNLTRSELARVAPHLRRQSFLPGSSIITAEQPGEVVYIILTGTVKVHVEQANGNDVILAILGADEIVGELSMVDSLGRSANVVTLEMCELIWIDRLTFGQLASDISAISTNLVRILARRLRLANAHIQSLASHDVFGRVARLIVAFAQEYGQAQENGSLFIPLNMTQSDFASLAGASRVRVNQVLNHYKQQQYISISSPNYIIVHNIDALQRRCI
jgi:CRP-like cAMP-binding protein